jgi:hypothetical protein
VRMPEMWVDVALIGDSFGARPGSSAGSR